MHALEYYKPPQADKLAEFLSNNPNATALEAIELMEKEFENVKKSEKLRADNVVHQLKLLEEL